MPLLMRTAWLPCFLLCFTAPVHGGDLQTMVTQDIDAASRWMAGAPPVPDFRVLTSKADWERQRTQIRDRLWQLLGKLPPRPKSLAVKTLSREDRGDFLFEKFQFDNGAGASVPGYLLLPKGRGAKAPAILYCHWHGGEYDHGKGELFEANHTVEPPGPAYARRGYAVIAVDAYCFGERNGQGPGGHEERGSTGEMTASKFNLWMGRTLWGMILRDDLMALDYLVSRPEIDPQRIGVAGMSMGATRSWWLMALDERIRAGVAVACLTRYQDLIAQHELKQHGIYYFVPGMLNYFDTEAIISLIAPRALLCMNGDRDGGSPSDGIRVIEQKSRPAYALYEASSNFESRIYPNVGHEYTADMWTRTFDWFDKWLQSH